MNLSKKLDLTTLRAVTESFSKARIMCIGDVVLDRFIYGSISRMSSEAPIPVVKLVRTTKLQNSERDDGIGRRLGPEPRDLPEELRPSSSQVIDVVRQHLVKRVVA